MRISLLWTLALAGWLGGCGESTEPGSDQAQNHISASRFGSGYTCHVSAAFVSPADVNAAEQIVVSSTDGDDVQGLLCDNKRGVSIDLGNLGGPWTSPRANNARGQVVGGSKTADDQVHAFLWGHGVMTDLGTLPGDDRSVANAISNVGQVVGESTAPQGDFPPTSRAFLWEKGLLVDLGTLPGMTWATANAVNARGQVVGTSGTGWSGSDAHAFLWEKGRMAALPGLGGAESIASDINAAGFSPDFDR